MNVVKVVSVQGHGSGGHFYSVLHIASALHSASILVDVYSIGVAPSPILQGTSLYRGHYDVSFSGLLGFYKVISNRPDAVLHAYDIDSYNILKTIFPRRGVVLTKCGGRVTKSIPLVKDIIFFSGEDKVAYQIEFPNASAIVLPNRVNEKLLATPTIQVAEATLPEAISGFKILRICRLNAKYEDSITSGIRLLEALHDRGLAHVSLTIIGIIEDGAVQKKIVSTIPEKIKSNVHWLTSEEFTESAVRFIPMFDLILATGRGVMEACMHSKPVVLACKGQLPILLTEQNFSVAGYFNFSERYKFASSDVSEIEALIGDTQKAAELQSFSRRMYDEWFDISRVTPVYENLYSSLLVNQSSAPAINHALANLVLLVRSWFRFIRARFRQ